MNDSNLNIAVVGSGRWGMNHVKTAHSLFGGKLKYVVDANQQAQEKINLVSPTIQFATSLDVVLRDETVKGVIIATPAETHFSVATQCLNANKNLLVEKPITLHSNEALELNELAVKKKLVLMVGHILLYHPAIIALKKMVTEGTIGKLQYIYSNRLNLGAIRSEENILWSFAPHDISVIQYLTESNPTEIDARGAIFLQKGIEDTTLTTLKYPDNIHAHIFVSWLHPFKEQRLVVVGEKGMAVFEDSLSKEKLKFFPKGFHKTDKGVEKFESDYHVIDFPNQQPLAEEQQHFVECIRSGEQPLTDGKHAYEVLKILEQATERLKNHA